MGLAFIDEKPKWNEKDWPPLEDGWRSLHASVVLHDSDDRDNDNGKAQAVVVLGGCKLDLGHLNSVLILNLEEQYKMWREGPPMKKSRRALAAVVCNGSLYALGGHNGNSSLDCIERINVNDLVQPPSATTSSHKKWKRLVCRLSTARHGCCAAAVHNRYIVVMGGYSWGQYLKLSSVDIVDTSYHTVIAGPSMAVPRYGCASAVMGHRIFVVGDDTDKSVEYLDFRKPCDNERTMKDFPKPCSSTWMTHPDLVLSVPRACAVATVGSCLLVSGGDEPTEVLDTYRNRVGTFLLVEKDRSWCTIVTAANHIAVIGGHWNASCATVAVMDKNMWFFCKLREQPLTHHWEGMGIREDANEKPCDER